MKWMAGISLRGRIALLTGGIILAVSLTLTWASMFNAGAHLNAFYDAVIDTTGDPAGQGDPVNQGDPAGQGDPVSQGELAGQGNQGSQRNDVHQGEQGSEGIGENQGDTGGLSDHGPVAPAGDVNCRATREDTLPAGLVVEMKRQFNYWSYAYLLLIAGLGMAASWFLAGRALAPVRRLSEAAVRVSGSNLAERIEECPAKDEIGELTCAFNGMMDRLEESFERQKRFSSNVAHELKTPLATMKMSLQMGRLEYEGNAGKNEENSVDGDDAAGIFTIAERSVDRLIGVVNDLLVLTNEGTLTMTDEIRLSELLQDVISELQPVYEHKKLHVDLEFERDFYICGDAGLVHRLFFNLVENAMKYNRQEGTVRIAARVAGEDRTPTRLAGEDGTPARVAGEDRIEEKPQGDAGPQGTVERKNRGIVVSVSDTGQGMQPEELEHIFEPFYCVDVSRSKKLGGVGLGLSIVKAAAERHGFVVSAESTLGEGSVFHVLIPERAEC